ncbi:MAG: endonuclease NucS [Candidatus Norongarragalinales archaeon]
MEFKQAKKAVEDALSKKKLVVCLGNCSIRYKGRAASKLSEGDRLLVIKHDGTFLVHQSTGMKAINYQGPGARVSVGEEGGALVVRAERTKPLHEVIEVRFKRIDFCDSFTMRDDTKLQLFGSEKELAQILMQDLQLIEKGLVPLKGESDVKRGSIDILAEDAAKNLVAIELKRRSAGLDAVTQLKRYVEQLQKRRGKRVRGILCAPEITENALKMLSSEGFEFFKLDYEIQNPSAKIRGLQKKQKVLGEF